MKVCGQKYAMEEYNVPAGENRQNLKQKDSFLFFATDECFVTNSYRPFLLLSFAAL